MTHAGVFDDFPSEPHPELNPVLLERRLGRYESAVNSAVDGIGRLEKQNGQIIERLDIANGRTRKNEGEIASIRSELEREGDRIANRFADVQRQLEEQAEARKLREDMESQTDAKVAAAFAAGASSVKVRLPIDQLATVTGLMIAVMTVLTKGSDILELFGK